MFLIFPECIGFHHECVRLSSPRIICQDKIKRAKIFIGENACEKKWGACWRRLGKPSKCKASLVLKEGEWEERSDRSIPDCMLSEEGPEILRGESLSKGSWHKSPKSPRNGPASVSQPC